MKDTTKQKTLIAIVGPTAVGKTAMAIAVAKHYDTVVLSADSRQFYKEMSIGTAKPNEEELNAVKHYFINSHHISEDYSAGDFERNALETLENVFSKHNYAVLVGGSGLFVRALCEGLDNLPKAADHIRESLNQQFKNEGLEPLKERLKEIDPVYFEKTDIENPQRVIRAIEVFEASGKPISSFQQNQVANRPFNIVTIGLNSDREQLYNKINQRVDLMMQAGLLDEVKGLINYKNKPALQTVGYAELFDYLDDKITLEDAITSIKQNSRRYAKRQITWFKKYGNTQWFEPNQFEDIIQYIENSK